MDDDSAEAYICVDCIGDTELKALLDPIVQPCACSYCDQTSRGISIAALAAEIIDPLRVALRQGGEYPQFTFDSDASYTEQSGEELEMVLQTELEIDLAPAEALAAELIEQDPADPRDGDYPFFEAGQLYERNEITDWTYSDTWRQFSEELKHHQRFFGVLVKEQLAQLLGERDSQEAQELPTAVIGGDGLIKKVFRARRVASPEQAKEVLKAPETELSAPPPLQATTGRMNPPGIPVFYGALSEDVAVAEVRPSVGGIVAIGSFLPAHALRLLDLTRMGRPVIESIFTAEYADRAARRRFMQSFHWLVTRPIQVQDEPLEYLPTQAVAEYVRHVLGFDGILYASSQTGWVDLDADLGEVREASDVGSSVQRHLRCNVAVFSEPSTSISSASDDSRTIPSSARFPLTHESGSAHVVMTTKVSYQYDATALAGYLDLDIGDERDVEF